MRRSDVLDLARTASGGVHDLHRHEARDLVRQMLADWPRDSPTA
jgi:hypothetical protein